MTDGRLAGTLIGDRGPIVVFCHGLLGRGRNFTTIAKALQPDFRCLLLDMPNHGASPWTDRFDYAEAAELVAAELTDPVAADGPVHVVGHSMGGKIAMTLALTHPELVDRIVVVDISPTGSAEVSEFAHLLDSLAQINLKSVTTLGEADEQLVADVPEAGLRGFLLQNLRRDPSTRSFGWQPNLDLLREDLAGIIGDIPPAGNELTFDHPVLWIAGADSRYVTAEQEPGMRKLFPLTRLLTVKGAGHWVHSQQPAIFTAALRRFLSA